MRFFDDASYTLLPYDKYRPFADLPAGPVAENKKSDIIHRAEEYAAHDIPFLPASLYMDYSRTGNRERFQAPYYERRNQLAALTLGEYFEGKGRFVEKIADLLWAICEETTWVIPAHNIPRSQAMAEIPGTIPLPDSYGDDLPIIDLFSATTASTVAWTLYFLGERISSEVSPFITEKAEFELDRRIVRPFLEKTLRWSVIFINNWCPWITTNILSVVSLCVKDPAKREAAVRKALGCLDAFTGTYSDDGGCNEGPSYWTAAGACWFDALEQLWDMSGGTIDVFGNDFCRRVSEYIVDMNITGDQFVTFADCQPHIGASWEQIYRFGKRVGSRRMVAFGASRADGSAEKAWYSYHMYRYVKNLYVKAEKTDTEPTLPAVSYNGLQAAVLRKGKFFTACKGGHNNESHNHNDVGNVIIYYENEPFLIDAGVDTYTADTFYENRYRIWTMQSQWHNLPTIGGHMQHEGMEYRAEGFSADCAGGKVDISFAEAYEKSCGAKECKRHVEVRGDSVSVSDTIRCEKAADVSWNFIFRDRPEVLENGIVLGSLRLMADLPCRIEIDSVELPQGGVLRTSWKRERLYRAKFVPETAKFYKISFTVKEK